MTREIVQEWLRIYNLLQIVINRKQLVKEEEKTWRKGKGDPTDITNYYILWYFY